MNQDDVDVALNAILEIRGELEAVVAKFPDTTAAKDISQNTVHTPMVCRSKKLMLKSNIYKVKKALFQHRSTVLSDQENKSVSRAFGFSFRKKRHHMRNKNQLTCMVSGTSFRVYMTASLAISL